MAKDFFDKNIFFALFFIPIINCNFVIIVFPSGGGIGHSIVQCGKEQENCEKIDHPQYMWISFMVIAQVGIYETLSFILKPKSQGGTFLPTVLPLERVGGGQDGKPCSATS